MVQITSTLSFLLACSTLSVAAPIVARTAAPKRLLNWNTWTPPALEKTQYFQPTIRTMAETTGQNFQFAQNFAQANPGAIVHTFNEPELNGISPQAAADAWNTILAPMRASTGCKLVSPGITNTQASVDWLNEFFGKITSQPDFLGLHFYDKVPDNLQSWLEARHGEHPFPIILSEIASTSTDQGTVDSMTKTWANYMDGADIVHQYAFFGAMPVLPNDGGFIPTTTLLMNSSGDWKPLLKELVSSSPMQ
ncbi:hypothetical protein EJ05DRAFT_82220 [Pseudovirgaria hyperparasitica]|uniref:Asl1-like glycosyl hydrolase catalytic domain-containing protein n=1 Tax=Pseudovirgaria hyperparasitica TaxID=470096 RepID=A0A6A6W1B3_9PEZI|nr:uncharacterized protein EJ05DRAFT_82220 [Pseudovirgaria hyperparasitica]KAF2755919.1 hypothetical protein EJ05DRAFT_82220 [Pseudovirgaria hyperparasitica]